MRKPLTSSPFASVLTCLALTSSLVPGAANAAPGRPGQPGQPAESESESELEPLHLSIAGPEADRELAGLLQSPVQALLVARGYRIDPAAPRGIFLIVHIDETAPDTHEIEVRLEHEGNTTFYPTTRCIRCGSTDLVDTIGRTLEPALDVLDAGGPPPPATEGNEGNEGDEGDEGDAHPIAETPPPPPPQTDNDPLGAKGIAGIALVSTGLTATVTGAALWASKESDHPTDPAMILRLKPPGIAMVAVGGAATISGIVLLVLDRKEARTRKTATAPLLGPGLAGLSLSGRF